MFDLPGVGQTLSSRELTLDSLATFVDLVIARVKARFNNFAFTNVWLGGEKYLTPIVTTTAVLSNSLAGLIMGNPFLNGRITLPRRFELVKHLGLLEIEKEKQFAFLNDLCMNNPTLAGCNKVNILYDIITNKSEPFGPWGEKYMTSLLNASGYLQGFMSLLSHLHYSHKVLIYTGQLDLNAGFQRVYGVLQHYGVGSEPSVLMYYKSSGEVRGYYKQNECWTLVELYNASASITHSQPETLSTLFSEFMISGQLSCIGTNCIMEAQLRRYMPNCTQTDWRQAKYTCTCPQGFYGINCTVAVLGRLEDESFEAYLAGHEPVYVEFTISHTGYFSVSSSQDCPIDMYANVYRNVVPRPTHSYDLPNKLEHDLHTRTKTLHVLLKDQETALVVLKIQNRCQGRANILVTYSHYPDSPVTVYAVLTAVLLLALTGLAIAIIWIYRKLRLPSPALPLLPRDQAQPQEQ